MEEDKVCPVDGPHLVVVEFLGSGPKTLTLSSEIFFCSFLFSSHVAFLGKKRENELGARVNHLITNDGLPLKHFGLCFCKRTLIACLSVQFLLLCPKITRFCANLLNRPTLRIMLNDIKSLMPRCIATKA